MRFASDPIHDAGETTAFPFTRLPAGDGGGSRHPLAAVLPSGAFGLAGIGV